MITEFSNEFYLWTNINVINRVHALMQKPPDEVTSSSKSYGHERAVDRILNGHTSQPSTELLVTLLTLKPNTQQGTS